MQMALPLAPWGTIWGTTIGWSLQIAPDEHLLAPTEGSRQGRRATDGHARLVGALSIAARARPGCWPAVRSAIDAKRILHARLSNWPSAAYAKQPGEMAALALQKGIKPQKDRGGVGGGGKNRSGSWAEVVIRYSGGFWKPFFPRTTRSAA